MGIKLVEEVMDWCPDLTAAQWRGLVVLARDANDETRVTYRGPEHPEILRRVRTSREKWEAIRSTLLRKGLIEPVFGGYRGNVTKYRIASLYAPCLLRDRRKTPEKWGAIGGYGRRAVKRWEVAVERPPKTGGLSLQGPPESGGLSPERPPVLGGPTPPKTSPQEKTSSSARGASAAEPRSRQGGGGHGDSPEAIPGPRRPLPAARNVRPYEHPGKQQERELVPFAADLDVALDAVREVAHRADQDATARERPQEPSRAPAAPQQEPGAPSGRPDGLQARRAAAEALLRSLPWGADVPKVAEQDELANLAASALTDWQPGALRDRLLKKFGPNLRFPAVVIRKELEQLPAPDLGSRAGNRQPVRRRECSGCQRPLPHDATETLCAECRGEVHQPGPTTTGAGLAMLRQARQAAKQARQ